MTIPLPRLHAVTDPRVQAARTFFTRNQEALTEATTILGGPASCRRCLRLAAAIAEAPRLTARLRRELTWLDRVLMLECVDAAESLGNSYFDLEPDDPIVHDLCRLADGLRDLLETMSSATAHDNGTACTADIADVGNFVLSVRPG